MVLAAEIFLGERFTGSGIPVSGRGDSGSGVSFSKLPEESNASPATLTSDGSRFLFKDMCYDFNANCDAPGT